MAESIYSFALEIQKILSAHKAEFSFIPDYSLPDMRVKRCVVVPMGIEKKIVSRNCVEKIFRVDVALLNKVKKESEIEPLLAEMESVSDTLLSRSVLSGICVKTDFEPLFASDMILQKNLFVGVISVSIKVVS